MNSVVYEQILERTEGDRAAFEGALKEMRDALLGSRAITALEGDVTGARDAIGAILAFYHAPVIELPGAVKGFFEELEYLLRPSGIMWRAVEIKGDWRRSGMGAMLATTTDGTAVALLPRRVSGYDLYDPATGRREKLTKKQLSDLSEEALCFYQPLPMRALKESDFFRYMLSTLRASDILSLALATLTITLVSLITGFANEYLFSQVVGIDVSPLPATLCMLIGAVLSGALFQVIESLALARVKTRVGFSCEAAAMSRVLSLPVTFFDRYSAGELASRVANVRALCDAVSTAAFKGVMTGLFGLIYIAQIFTFAPSLGVPALLVMLCTAALAVLSALSQMRHARRLMREEAAVSGLQYALVSGVQKLKLTGAERRGFAKWGKAYAREVALRYNPPLLNKLGGMLTLGVSLIGTIIMYVSAAKGGVSGAGFMAFSVAYGMAAEAFLSLSGIVGTLSTIRPMLDQISPILETAPEMSAEKEIVTKLNGGIELSNVSFRYAPDEPFLLEDISIKIRPGQYVALVGRTGCGKSTLMKLLLGFVLPEKGSIYFDGQDLRRLDAQSLRRHIGMVT